MIGFILTAHDRIDDLLAHLDILKFFPVKAEIIPIWMRKDVPSYFLDEMKKYKHAHYVDGISFRVGPLLALVSGMRRAKEIGLKYIVYRNGDDWLFNHGFCLNNFNIMTTKDIAAYNWLTYNTIIEFALNELYLRIDKFMETIDEAEMYFRGFGNNSLCEMKMAKWIKRTLDNFDRLYRLPGREIFPGVGYEIETLPEVFSTIGEEPPPEFWKGLEENSRFFNRKWQLIGSHNNHERYRLYAKIRAEIPYASELEKLEHFKRWIDFPSSWNMPIDLTVRGVTKRNKPFSIKMLPRQTPKKLIVPARKYGKS